MNDKQLSRSPVKYCFPMNPVTSNNGYHDVGYRFWSLWFMCTVNKLTFLCCIRFRVSVLCYPFADSYVFGNFVCANFNKPTKFMHKMGTIASLFMPWISAALFCNTNDSFLWKKQKNVCCGYYTGKMCCMSCAIFTFTLCTYNVHSMNL